MRKVPNRHLEWLGNELAVMETERVVDAETAARIRAYYAATARPTGGIGWALIVFAALGALLIGSGIILVFAHNWDELPRSIKTVLAFCPLLAGIGLSLAAILRNGGTALRECAGIFHGLAVGAAIGLVGQIYHTPSNLPGFFLAWALLALPLAFMLDSTGVFLLYLGLLCGWAGAAQENYGQAFAFWPLLAPAFWFLVRKVRHDRHAPATLVSAWGLMAAATISLGIVFEKTIPGLWTMAYAGMLSGFYLLGRLLYAEEEGWGNPFATFGVAGVSLLAYLFTWTDYWEDIGWQHHRHGWAYQEWGVWVDFGVTMLFMAGWACCAVATVRRKSAVMMAVAVLPLLATLAFVVQRPVFCAVLFNGYLLLLGVLFIVSGCRKIRLRLLNGGMFLVGLLVVTRFFDDDFGFLARGIAFIAMGVCFLAANVVMARRKKEVQA